MKGTRSLLGVLVFLGLIVLTACGGGGASSTLPPPQASTAPVSFTIRDAPPANVTVLSFEVTVVSASLQSNTGKPDFPLVTTPIKIEIKQLEVESAFLSTANVPADTYKSVTVQLQNPELTIKNDTGNSIPGCNADPITHVCEIKLTMSTNVVFSGAPFPLTVVANSPTGLLVDVNLANAVTSALGVDFSAAGAVTITQLTAQQGTGQLEEMEDVHGTVANKDAANNQFILQSPHGNLTIKVDTNTVFEDFDKLSTPCTANPQNFTCVQNGQMVEVDIRLIAGGAMLAKKVEAQDDAQNAEDLEGIITGNITATGFDLVLIEKISNITSVEIGNAVHINLVPGFTFRVDKEKLNVSPGLRFSEAFGTADLMVGQRVEVKRVSSSAGPPPTINAIRVTLKKTAFRAKVKSKLNSTDFLVDNLPPLFVNATPAILQIEVRTTIGETGFDGNVANLAALNVGDTVSVRGLLFKQAVGDPVLVAKKVRKR